MSSKSYDNHSHACVCDVVHFINDIQDAAVEDSSCPTNCLNPVLGGNKGHHSHVNTRPFILYTKDGKPFEPVYKNDYFESCDDFCEESKFLRVENVDGCCAVVRVLKCACDDDHGDHSRVRFEATDTCITVDLTFFSAIQCLEDTFVSL
ncbi:CotY/CotZ family spore coat protein [Heyndrickxia acidiproducens]|jgi:spore coat protein Z|uniref:CotY/CotZ family spore coat protein n=1 Tax=Heyndrickxia acidiproducens TaxID=1121084 RepID=UPI00038138A2|nr:CotY/CotZ family spore coat protein [Heyndrickxia acidiproducens]